MEPLEFDTRWNRDIGYGVPAFCDHPACTVVIDRGLLHVCGGGPSAGDDGCGLHFCAEHLAFAHDAAGDPLIAPAGDHYLPLMCPRCVTWFERQDHSVARDPFPAKPDHPDWIRFKLADDSWLRWRAEHPEQVAALTSALRSAP